MYRFLFKRFHSILVLFSFIPLFSSLNILYAQSNPNLDGKYGLNYSLEELHTRSLLECHVKCYSNPECLTYFFHFKKQKCILHRDTFMYTKLEVTEGGWRHYYTKDGSGRCPPADGFWYYRKLTLCFNLNVPMTLDFSVVKLHCASLSAELIRIDSVNKQEFIEFITANEPTERVCIQGSDTVIPGVWTFDDGTPMNYFNWNEDSQEPDGGQGYLEIMQSAGGRWHDVKKFYPAYLCLPICERR